MSRGVLAVFHTWLLADGPSAARLRCREVSSYSGFDFFIAPWTLRRKHIPDRQMNTRISALLSSCCLLCVIAGCDGENNETSTELRATNLDGQAFAAEIEAEPNTVFFVDLRDTNQYTFDQATTAIDWDHVVVQTMIMEHPMPMSTFAAQLGLDIDAPNWTLGAAGLESSSSKEGLRALMPPGCECIEVDGWAVCVCDPDQPDL